MERSNKQVLDSARDFASRFTPLEGRDYRWVIQYASDHFERLHRAWTSLDEKADRITSYLGGGTGLFAIGTIATITEQNWGIYAWALPSVALALLAIVLAAWSRRPRAAAIPPSIEDATRYVGSIERDQEAHFLGQWHLTCESLRVATGRKAALVRWAMLFFASAVGALVVPIVVAILRAAR